MVRTLRSCKSGSIVDLMIGTSFRVTLVAGAILCALAGAVYSQAPSYGEIVFAEGREFTIVRDGEAQTFQTYQNDVLGYRLQKGDLIQTGSATLVEIQILPKGTVLKLAENSSFLIQGMGTGDETVMLSLVYGRLRAKVAKLSGKESFSIRSGATVAGVRGTDFGFDMVIKPMDSGAAALGPRAEIYCFSGEVEVAPLWPETLANAGIAPTSGTVTIKADQLVSIDLSRSLPIVERRTVDEAVKAFWIENAFKGSTQVPAPESSPLALPLAVPEEAAGPAWAPESVPILPQPDFKPYKRAISLKNIGLGSSALIALAGLGAQGFGLYQVSGGESELGNNLIISGGLGISVSVVISVVALLIGSP